MWVRGPVVGPNLGSYSLLESRSFVRVFVLHFKLTIFLFDAATWLMFPCFDAIMF